VHQGLEGLLLFPVLFGVSLRVVFLLLFPVEVSFPCCCFVCLLLGLETLGAAVVFDFSLLSWWLDWLVGDWALQWVLHRSLRTSTSGLLLIYDLDTREFVCC